VRGRSGDYSASALTSVDVENMLEEQGRFRKFYRRDFEFERLVAARHGLPIPKQQPPPQLLGLTARFYRHLVTGPASYAKPAAAG
jgi:hypothetical protein